ncbi:excreted virulence factor EspC (type VII ESX diderm) [Prauserella shujinwangii]|uniref:Excreted virulence factor EspC (Type VII ESX diderm) n=1 Tax=Prauserella shujinwangii TaxID=1453103 RepID=A0A2T0LS98_9PSEU|nr:type VII secretion target [Prauserella shujinwangii]PRX46536.1 excreted virulence factor EspC (type VII ESX diderm) [Prauserella shujinwangii]
MTHGGFEVDGDLDAHAGQLDDCTGMLRQAADAARQVSMPTDAYGILCQPFRMLLDPVEQYGIDALDEAVTAMEAAADKVRTAARRYRGTEEGFRSALRAGE